MSTNEFHTYSVVMIVKLKGCMDYLISKRMVLSFTEVNTLFEMCKDIKEISTLAVYMGDNSIVYVSGDDISYIHLNKFVTLKQNWNNFLISRIDKKINSLL